MKRRNLAAYTPPIETPAFASFNQEDDGTVSLHVRSQGDGRSTGVNACIYISREVAIELLAEALCRLVRP